MGSPNGGDELIGGRRLQQKATGTRAKRVVDVFVQVEGRQDQDAGPHPASKCSGPPHHQGQGCFEGPGLIRSLLSRRVSGIGRLRTRVIQPWRWSFRQPPARLFAMMALTIRVSARALIASPRRIATVRAVLFSWPAVMIPSGSGTIRKNLVPDGSVQQGRPAHSAVPGLPHRSRGAAWRTPRRPSGSAQHEPRRCTCQGR